MHPKHRNGPGNMYRSNSMGVGGVAAASRISPEGSARGHRMYSTEYRNYNRDGYGRLGRSKHIQSVPPPQEVDIFVEAGRLAAEYLVSKGVLPSDALSGKWQNDVLKNREGNFQEFRQHQVDRTQTPANGRASVHSRLGNTALEAGPGRIRYSDEYNSVDSRTLSRERKRTGPFKNYGTEVNRESGRSESWAEKSKASPGKEADDEASFGHNVELPGDKDGTRKVLSPSPYEVTDEVVSKAHTEPAPEQCSLVKDADARNSSLSNEKHLPSDAEGELIKWSDDANKFDAANAVEERITDNDWRQKDEKAKEVMSSSRADTSVSESHFNLVKHCKFVNVPTKTRSSLMNKGSKGDPDAMTGDANISKKENVEGSSAHSIDDNTGSSRGNVSSQESQEVKHLQSDVLDPPHMEKEVDVVQKSSPRQCLGSESLTETSQCKRQEPDEQLSEFQSSNSMFGERGEKRSIGDDSDEREDFKKFRQWLPPLDASSDGSLLLSSSMEEQPSTQEPRTSQSAHVTQSPDQKSLDNSLFPRGQADSSEFIEEKQLFPGSFKTCDLNLVGTSDVNENHDADQMFVFQSVTPAGKVGPIGIDLSMSNNHTPDKNDKHSVQNNDIEVIDLDSDSAPEHKTFTNPERRGDAVFADLDGFPNNVHNPTAIPDVQDGYGLMISELLANGSPNCSSVPTDLNSLNNHMGLPNTEQGMLGDDDSIYMSLEEIPISLLGPWEQPTQDYGKPF